MISRCSRLPGGNFDTFQDDKGMCGSLRMRAAPVGVHLVNDDRGCHGPVVRFLATAEKKKRIQFGLQACQNIVVPRNRRQWPIGPAQWMIDGINDSATYCQLTEDTIFFFFFF
jgi:hypothetical protein